VRGSRRPSILAEFVSKGVIKMELLITLDNGEEYVVPYSFKEFEKISKNDIGVLINGFIKVQPDTWINPNHISSVKVHK